MKQLIWATVIWAFSFSLIGEYLSGRVDPYFSAAIRILFAALFFLPFALRKRVPSKVALRISVIGAIQLGMMYVFYFKSFELLTVPEVLIFTTLTPIYVTLFHDIWNRRISLHHLWSAIIAVTGALVIRWGSLDRFYLVGILSLQGCNLCFAFGQIAYKNLKEDASEKSLASFFYFFIGALIPPTTAWLFLGSAKYPTELHQLLILVWLGIVASGIGYFLWNRGAKKTNAGALAVMNNLLIPAGLLVNLLIWGHDTNLIRFFIGGGLIMLSLYLNQRWRKKKVAH